MGRVLLLFILFIILTCLVAATTTTDYYKKVEIEFLKSYFERTENARFIIYLCWPKYILSQFFHQIKNKEISISLKSENLLQYHDKFGNKDLRILDLTCPAVAEILQKASDTELFLAPNRWLLLDTNSTFDDLQLNSIRFLLDSEVIIARYNYENETMLITQPYKYSRHDTEIVFEQFGYWTKDEGVVDTRKNPVTSFRRKNLQSRVLRGSVVASLPNTMENLEFYKPERDSLTKHCHALNLLLVQYMNATYKIEAIDGWGRLYPNGTWTGVVGKLWYKEDDIAGTGVFMNDQRAPYIHYIWRSCKTKVIYIFRRPPLSYVSNIFSLSFQRNVWISSAALTLLVVVVVYCTVAWEMDRTDPSTEEAATVPLLQKQWSDVCLFVLGGICQQGCEVEPRGYSGRIATLFLFMSLMFLYVSYSANIVALLQSTSDEIHSLKDLQMSKLQLGFYDIEYAHSLKIATDDPLQTLINNKIDPVKGFYSLEDGVKKIQKGMFGFLVEAGPCYKQVAEVFQENEKCDLEEVALSGRKFRDVYAAIPKRSPYREVMTVACFKLEEYGLQQRSFLKVYTEKPVCANAAANFVMVGLVDSYLAFVIWGCGAGLAAFLLLFEKWFWKLDCRSIKTKLTRKLSFRI